jgi:hypothetical protein
MTCIFRVSSYGITMITISFKVTENEAQAIRVKARQERVTVSEFLRRQAASSTGARTKPGLQHCPMTGATIFTPGSDMRSLTVASTRELLMDFP